MIRIPIRDFSPATIPPGTTEIGLLDVFQDLFRPVELPLMVARGSESGPTVVVVAGVHGDEYEGMEAIRCVFAALDPLKMRGTFLAIPVANPFAYEARARIAPLHIDGLNLARVFPGDPNGSPSRRLAFELLDFVERHVGPEDLFIDFHSGSADAPYATVIGYRDVPGAARERAEEIARHFGIERLWRIPDASGPFNAETARRGIVTLGTETTGRAGCDPADVAAYVQGLRNVLAFLGVCPHWPSPARGTMTSRTTINVDAPDSGFFRRSVELYDRVESGDPLGTIIDHFGRPIREVVAPVAGEIWAIRSMPPARTGELLAMIARDDE